MASNATQTRFAVVSWSGTVPIHLSPRGQRTAHFIDALAPYGRVERVGGTNIPRWLAGNSDRVRSSWYRRLGRNLIYSILIDKYEISAKRALRAWSPEVNGAVLVGHPFSPIALAAQKLVRRQIPYLVDIGDPWILTNPHAESGWLRRLRAARWERKLWASACGVIVTTKGQGEALKHLFPHLRVLVRPNGYNAPDRDVEYSKRAPVGNELRLVHYGSLHGARVNFQAIFERLAHSGKWSRITLRQYGADWDGVLGSVSHCIDVDRRPPLPWTEILKDAQNFHAAVVIGWRNPDQMPSKAVQYLTLPIPRIAMTSANPADALTIYATDKPGWAVIDDEDPRASEIIMTHVSRAWPQVDLQAPESESWKAVEHLLGDFAVHALGIWSANF